MVSPMASSLAAEIGVRTRLQRGSSPLFPDFQGAAFPPDYVDMVKALLSPLGDEPFPLPLN